MEGGENIGTSENFDTALEFGTEREACQGRAGRHRVCCFGIGGNQVCVFEAGWRLLPARPAAETDFCEERSDTSQEVALLQGAPAAVCLKPLSVGNL